MDTCGPLHAHQYESVEFLGWESGRKRKDGTRERFSQSKREKSLFEGGWRGVEEEGEERLASLKSPNPLTSVAGAKMEDHTAF